MSDNEELYLPPTQHISNVCAVADFSSRSSSDSAKYKRAWIKAKVIRSFNLSSGECTDACSRELYIAMNHKEIASIMAVTGAISPQKYANAINRHEQKKQKISHATSVGNKRKNI